MAQKSHFKLYSLVDYSETLFSLITDHIQKNPDCNKKFIEAAYSLISTLVLVDPENFTAKFLKLATENLDASKIEQVTDEEIEVWKTPKGKLYNDILQKNKSNTTKNKGNATEQWEHELRMKIAEKSTGPSKLTKEEQQLVEQQLKKEEEVRERVQVHHDNVTRGLKIVHALVTGNSLAFEKNLANIVPLLLRAAATAWKLVGDKIADIFVHLGSCLPERFKSIKETIAYSTLRALEVPGVPSEWQEEKIGDMIIRALYRLRFNTEGTPLSASSFSYCLPLLKKIIEKNGLGEVEKIEIDEEGPVLDGTNEQTMIAFDIISFHCSLGII